MQTQLSKCIQLLERATLMVNDLSLFSQNETAEEISTSDIRWSVRHDSIFWVSLYLESNMVSMWSGLPHPSPTPPPQKKRKYRKSNMITYADASSNNKQSMFALQRKIYLISIYVSVSERKGWGRKTLQEIILYDFSSKSINWITAYLVIMYSTFSS